MTNDPRHIRIEDYTYELPNERIAKYPLPNREQSKLLFYGQCNIAEKQFSDITSLLSATDLLVFNNTRVIQARLVFHKESGARIEVFCLEPLLPSEYVLAFESKERCTWKCLIGNAKKWKDGDLTLRIEKDGKQINLKATKGEKLPDAFSVEFSWDNQDYCFGEVLEATGILPIPPYLNRETEQRDYQSYQTVYSQIKGSVAAPTAGLHFSDRIIEQLKQQGTNIEEVTLHVGAGTFKPVSSEEIGDHTMHSEQFFVNRKNIEALLENQGRLIAVGTTSVRTLESLYWLGLRIHRTGEIGQPQITQWEAYENEAEISPQQALENLLDYLQKENLDAIEASTQIMITPAYKFKIVQGLITNFHLPKSTLLLLIASLIGKDWKRVYDFALANDFRFLSYGDSSLLLP